MILLEMRPATTLAASVCIGTVTCEYVSRVMPTFAWPRRSWLAPMSHRCRGIGRHVGVVRCFHSTCVTSVRTRQTSSSSLRRRLIGQAPSEVLAITVWVSPVAGSCTDRNDTPAS